MSVEASKLRGANLCTSAGATALSGGVTTTTTTNTIQYSVAGLALTKTAMAGVASPTSDAVTAALFSAAPLAINTGSVFVLCLDASGTLKVVQGTVQALNSAGNFQTSGPQFPDIPDTLTPFAYAVVRNGSTGSAWTYGTSNWNATGITVNVHDVHTLPKLPAQS